MPQPPAQAPANVRDVINFTNDDGVGRPPNPVTTASAILPIPLAPQLLGIDAATFQLTAANGYSQTITFSALPSRNNTINPLNALQSSGTNVTILAKDQLIFLAFPQGVAVAPADYPLVSVTPLAIDTSNVRVPGPFLGSNTFQTFQAVVSAYVPTGFTGTISGMVAGMLYLSIG